MSKEELLDNILNKAQEAINHLKEANNLIGNISILCKVNNIPNSEELKDYQDFHNAYSIQKIRYVYPKVLLLGIVHIYFTRRLTHQQQHLIAIPNPQANANCDKL